MLSGSRALGFCRSFLQKTLESSGTRDARSPRLVLSGDGLGGLGKNGSYPSWGSAGRVARARDSDHAGGPFTAPALFSLRDPRSCLGEADYPCRVVLATQSCLTLCDLMDCGPPARLFCPWESPGKNTGVGGHALFRGIFPTQGLNPGLLHCRQILYHLSHQGSPSVEQKRT